MEELPKIPGNTFPDLTRTEYNVPHHFDWHNGYPIVKPIQVGIGKHPLDTEKYSICL
uniref:Ef-hand domain-containing protein 1-like protein n=1 Tax=Triatoma infestans TaxID=30076 RepID=A0A170WMS3_TRIIF